MFENFDIDNLEADMLFEQLSIEDEEVIQEVAVVKGKNGNFSLHVTPDLNRNVFEENAYFKWVNHINFDTATEIARINFANPVYTIHKRDRGGKKSTTLNRSQKNELIKTLTMPAVIKNAYGIDENVLPLLVTNWQYLIYRHNKDYGISDAIMLSHLDLKEDRKDLPDGLVRLTLPMPNYLMLD